MEPTLVTECPSCAEEFDWEKSGMKDVNYCPACQFPFMSADRYETCFGCKRLFDVGEADMILSDESTLASMEGGLQFCSRECKRDANVV